MKLANIENPQDLLDVVDQCVGTVELVTPEGDRLNLKSKLCQYISRLRVTVRFPVRQIVDVRNRFCRQEPFKLAVCGEKEHRLRVLAERFSALEGIYNHTGINDRSHMLLSLASLACSSVGSLGRLPNRDLAISTLSWCGFESFATTFPLRVIKISSVAASIKYLPRLFFNSVAVIDTRVPPFRHDLGSHILYANRTK